MSNSTPSHRNQERQVRNLQALLEVSKSMSGHLSLDALLQVIIQKTTEVMEADRSTLFLFDQQRNLLWTKIAQGLDKSSLISFELGQGIAGQVAVTGKCANISDAYSAPNFNPTFDKQTGYHTKSILCMPLITANGHLLGVIQVLNKKGERPFDQDDESLLEALSTHVTLALERSQLIEAFVEKERMEETLRLAHDIQMNFLPRSLPPFSNSGTIDLHALLIPAHEVGGDLYDYFLIDEEQLFFVIGDVAGKGVPAALFMAVTKTLIKAFARKGLPPHEVLLAVNEELCLRNDSCTFVTLFCGILNTTTGRLRYANAGHNPPFFISKGGEGRYLNLSGGMAAGIDTEAKFSSHSLELRPDESILLYTDGITEARNGQNELFSEQRLSTEIMKIHTHSSETITSRILEQVRRFSSGQPQSDDIAMISIKMKGPQMATP